MRTLLLGIDVGTTAVKAVIVDIDGKVLSIATSNYATYHLQPGWVEQDPLDWWRGVVTCVRTVLGEVEGAAERIASLAVSSQAPTLLPVDIAGNPLRRAMIWMDRRAEAECNALKQLVGDAELVRRTHNRVDPFYVAPKILWLRGHEPRTLKETRWFLQINGFINHKLTGQVSLDAAHAGLLLLRNPQGEWQSDLCEACGVRVDQFPLVSEGTAIIGQLTGDAAAATGLRVGTPVCAGTVDSAAAAIETGVIDKGSAAEMTGTSTVLIMPAEASVYEPAFVSMPHALPGRHLLLGAMSSSGANLQWFLERFGYLEKVEAELTGKDPYDLLTNGAQRAPVGSSGVVFLPYMMGERSPIWHTAARGVFFGLSLATERESLIRSILEGSAYALRHNLEVAQNVGVAINAIRSVGGGARSQLWNQIKADVIGRSILIPEAPVGAAYGAALLAGMAIGVVPYAHGTSGRSIKITRSYEPNPENNQRYTDLYHLYRSLYDQLRPCFDAAAMSQCAANNQPSESATIA